MSLLTYERGVFKEPNSIFGKTLLLCIIILFTTRILTRTPLIAIYLPFEALWYLIITSFTFIYALNQFFIKKKADEIHYLFLLMFVMPIQAGVGAHLSEGFPIMSGFFAQRHWIGMSGVILILYMFQTGFVTMKDLLRSFEWLAWGTFTYFIWCYLFLNPQNYLDQAFVGYSDIKGGYRFKFGIDFIAFAGVYYTVRYVKERSRKMLLNSGIMLSYLFFLHQGRSVMLAEVGSIAVFYMFEVNFQRVLRIFITVGISFMVIMGIMYAIIPDRVNDYIIQYTSLFTMVFTGSTVGESSVDARLEEIGILFVYLLNYPIGWVIGLGKFASSEACTDCEHGITTVPPGDIGILGSVMTYGILGTLIIYGQFVIAFRSSLFIRRYKNDAFVSAAKYFLVFCFLSSLAKGYLFMQPGSTAIFIMIIYAYKLLEVDMDKRGIPVTPILNFSK